MLLCCLGACAPPTDREVRGSRLAAQQDALVDDVLQFLSEVAAPAFPPLPVFLRGQSLGGLVALAAVLRSPELFSGLALGAPAYELRWLLSPFAPRAITAGGEAVRSQIQRLQTPLAVFQGVGDTTCDAAGARHLVTSCGSEAKALYLYSLYILHDLLS